MTGCHARYGRARTLIRCLTYEEKHLACGARELASALANAIEAARAFELLACRLARGGRRGVVGAVVAVVDDDPFGVAVLGARASGELGLGGVGVLGDRRVSVAVVDAPGGALIGNDVHFGHGHPSVGGRRRWRAAHLPVDGSSSTASAPRNDSGPATEAAGARAS